MTSNWVVSGVREGELTRADPGFQVRGVAHLKELRRAEGGANILGVFRVKNHDFMPKNHIFSNFRGGAWIRPGICRIITAGFSPVVLLPLYIILK